MEYDFAGWATRNDLKCSDGRVIQRDAFKHNDGKKVPLVWNHSHDDPLNVLGHAVLENKDEGVYAYCTFNDTEQGNTAKELVKHGDIAALSIYANKLKQNGPYVQHGNICEVSLVLAGANPGAYIDSIIAHGEESEDEAVIYTGESLSNYVEHSSDKKDDDEEAPEKESKEEKEEDEMDNEDTRVSDSKETVGDVWGTLSEKQQNVVYAIIGQILEDAGVDTSNYGKEVEHSDMEEDYMKKNVFDQSESEEEYLSHSDMQEIFDESAKDVRNYGGSLKDSFLAHADNYGISDIDYLFPDAKNYTEQPQFIQREMDWVQKVINGTHHTPFSRVKTIFADITKDEARAKGYMKGNRKTEEVFTLLKRTTTPTTIYKKQKLDRDDITDITDFDVVAWVKSEMRTMLDEEIARAILIGDGRMSDSDDKINEQNIRPIWTDDDLYTVKADVDPDSVETNLDDASLTENEKLALAFIETVIRSRKEYKGSGNPTLFTTEDMLTNCLLLKDVNNRYVYDSVEQLANKLRVSQIVTVEPMEDQTREVDGKTKELLGIYVNLDDYNVGADKGGSVSMFDDFDIDYNQQKYLMETRCSGALVKPYSAVALEMDASTSTDQP